MADDFDWYFDPEVLQDPYPFAERLRARCPVAREPRHGAFAVTGFDEAVVLTVDAKGEYDSTVVWHGSDRGLKRLRTYEHPNSLGLFSTACGLFGTFATASLCIVGIGILGQLAMSAVRRTREVGIRLACGATRGNIVWLMFREQLVPVVLGLVVGRRQHPGRCGRHR